MFGVLVLLAPVAIVFSFVYLLELRTFLQGLQGLQGVAQTTDNVMTHGADTGSYTYDKSKIAVAGATGALGSMGGAVADKAAGPALNALQKAAAPEASMVIVKTVVDKAVDKANGVSPGPGHAHQLKKK